METPERIWFLLSRNLSGDATAADREELLQLLQQHPELMQQYDLLQQLWPVNALPQHEETSADQDAINRIVQRAAAEDVDARPAPARVLFLTKWRKIIGIAAAVAALLATVWLAVEWRKQHSSAVLSEIVAPKGSKTRTILPDGTTVWLNAGSRIKYAGFNGGAREVILEGEAYFDVVHVVSHTTGRKQPFIVHAGNIDIQVLGTAFNVKSYPEENTIETTLIRGLVQITRKGRDKDPQGAPVILHPNEKIVLPASVPAEATAAGKPTAVAATGKAPQQITRIDSTLRENERVETAWVYNRLEFRGDNFEQLATKLERWYNVKIHFEDEAARKLVFTGSLENETIEEAFSALKAAVPFNATINNNEVFIKSSK